MRFLLLLLPICSFAADPAPGRFQLLNVSITDTDDGRPRPVVLRIDTATGKVDELATATGELTAQDGSVVKYAIQGWRSIPESFGAEFNRFLELKKNNTAAASLRTTTDWSKAQFAPKP